MEDYTEEELEYIKNIYQTDLTYILKHRKLTLMFCINFILNEEYQTTSDEKDLDLDSVYCHQAHLREEIKRTFPDF